MKKRRLGGVLWERASFRLRQLQVWIHQVQTYVVQRVGSIYRVTWTVCTTLRGGRLWIVSILHHLVLEDVSHIANVLTIEIRQRVGIHTKGLGDKIWVHYERYQVKFSGPNIQEYAELVETKNRRLNIWESGSWRKKELRRPSVQWNVPPKYINNPKRTDRNK